MVKTAMSSLAAACKKEGLVPLRIPLEAKSTKTKSGGAFEACFATGLDLSEFATSNGTKVPSASAQLLRIKAKESADRQLHELEEARMQQIVQQRTHRLKQQEAGPRSLSMLALPIENTNCTKNERMLGDLLGNIHGNDVVNQSKASRELRTKERRLTKQYMKKLKEVPAKAASKRKKRSKY
mmetsp:Transcript_16176/g.21159  ORF Transcript_16176/g.21159 Transcript_16176/m.21159 type:complete len:182 (+) Transcript_16176:117-662(+)